LTDAVRSFLIKTLLEDRDATKGLDNLLAKATRLTEKAYTMTVSVATTQAEKALATVEKAAKAAANIDSSKATKGQKEQAQATATLTDRLKLFSEHSKKAGEATNGFFSKLDAGRLVMAGAAGGLALYAKSVIEVYEAHKLAKDMITDQLGGAASTKGARLPAHRHGAG
jgi:predicted helicase